jgi:transcription termination/antitermination protein NusG
LIEISTTRLQDARKNSNYAHLFDDNELEKAWHVLWTRSNYEKLVYDHLHSKGYEVFLPLITEWSGQKEARRPRKTPMFKGYLFLYGAIDRYSYLDISNTGGLVSILGHRWDRLAHVPDKEIESIRLTVINKIPGIPYPFIENGDRVRITKGSLANTEGILVRSEPNKGLFIISINLLRRSIAVEVDYENVVPA